MAPAVPPRQPAVAVARAVQQLVQQGQPRRQLRFLRFRHLRLARHQTQRLQRRERGVERAPAAAVRQQVDNAVVAVGEAAVRQPLLPHQAPQ